MKSNVEFRHTFRFNSFSSFTRNVTAKSLVACAGGIATGSNNVTAMCVSAKIHRIRMWTIAQGTTSVSIQQPITCSVEFLSPAGSVISSSNMEYSSTTLSSATPAYIDVRPPAGSQASFWNLANNNSLLTLSASGPTIVDVDASFIMDDEPSIQVTNATVASATVNQCYFLALDGTGAGVALVPVSLQTIA
jgi:hypothetical protein